jgi:ankyrin repeat protein
MTAQYGCEATAKLLLDHGANIEAQDLDNKTAIHIASWINHDETARLLIAKNANIRAQLALERTQRADISYSDKHITYFSTNSEELDCFLSAAKNLVAAVKGDSAMVKFLLDCGANIEARDSQQQTALHLAASVGHDTTVWLLRIRGANIDSKDRHNQTPKDLAKEKAYTLTAQLLPSQLPSQSRLSQPQSGLSQLLG